ncbi:T9SS type B sorting domain-containing protein [Flavobacterium sp.]|jgi:gliding motility-associated-like protein|uniref:Ig-like domain-containing protein n=1 Tax=Flavobacterium sp. TaxID=239 RepID=UPI002A81D0E4|nr:T9SS type B sorting domain-containing protein [Flavobacterium sp.]
MKHKCFFIIIIFFNQINLFGQNFNWVREFSSGSFSGETSSLLEVDNNENSYTFGIILEDFFDLDPTISGTQIIDNSPQSLSAECSLFLTKLDSNGNFIWGRTFGSIFGPSDRVIDIEIGSDGNIYLLADIYEQTSFIQKFITIFKIDVSGNILLTKKITNLNNPNQSDVFSSSSLALDSQNNIFITGSYKTFFKIDMTNPELNFTLGGDSFLLKFDNNGNILWGKNFGIGFTNYHYEEVKIDNSQSPILIYSNGDNQSNISTGYFIKKINSNNGSTLWQFFLDNQIPITFNIDYLDNIIIAGNGSNPNGNNIDVDPNSTSVFIAPTRYILWLTNNGEFIDVKQYPPINPLNYFKFSKIDFDINNNTYIIGEFNYSFDADPSSNSFILNYNCFLTPLVRDAFFIKFDNNRNFENAFKLGDYNNNCLNFYFTDFKIKNESQFFVGNYSNTADFDPTSDTFTLSSNSQFGSRFTLKLDNCDSTIPIGDSNQYFCSSQNPTISNLTPNSGIIKWYSSSTSTTHLPSATPLVNGTTYYASNQSGTCPESITRLEVTVNITQSPSSPIANNQSFCDNENATLNNINATGQNLTWYDINNNQISNNTILQNNTTYYVSQTINGCESNKAPVLILVNSTPIPLLISPQQFCIQENATLNYIQITGQNILWYDVQTGGNLLPTTTVLQNGITYYASQTINGCESNRVPVTITIQNTAAPSGNGNQSFCSTANATLGNIAINGSNLIWYDSQNGNTILPSSTLLANNSTYFATQTVNNCESPTRLAITISLINTLNATNYSESICDDLNNGTETVNLTNYNSNLISATGNTFSYYISSNGAENQLASEQINNSSNYNLTVGNHIIYVRIDSPNTCHQVVELNLTLFSKPVLNINDVMPICEGSSITISAGNGFDNYLWSTNETTSSITVSQPGNYSLTVSENHGTLICSTTKNFTVVNSNIGTISEIISSDWTANENTISVSLSSNSNGDYEYSLNGADYQDSNVFNNLENGEYTVYIRDKNGCGINFEEIYLLMHPKYFTPNDDGINDFWKIKFSENEPNLIIKIFDRYGKFIKQLGPNSIGWDGTYLGEQAVSSDYWFVVVRENGKEHKGHFSLIR